MSAANAAQSAAEDGDTHAMHAGARLLAAREARQLNLREVAQRTRQSKETLEALEKMETAHIPAGILRLQAKNYARFLGLPEEEIASEFAPMGSGPAIETVRTSGASNAPSNQVVMFGAGAIVVAASIIGGAIMLAQPRAPETEDRLAVSARLAPAFSEIDDINDLVGGVSEEFGIFAVDRAWIEVRGSDGTVFRSREMMPGESYFPRKGAGWTITVQDAGAFEWRLGDLTADAVGETGQSLYSVSVDSALQAAIAARSAALAETSRAPGQQ
ncbi:MAG: helix-turn-helix domain-containing protein [Pseudomonadota bacterium]